VTIYRILFSGEKRESGPLDLGPTPARLAGVPVFLLPNPSGRNAHYSYRAMLKAFQTLRKEAGSQ
jgi:TDG/mug DNA glycosylase family protein